MPSSRVERVNAPWGERAVTGTRRRPMLPPAYFGAAVVAMLALSRLLPVVRLVTLPGSLFGIVPMLLGMILNLGADRALKTHDTTVKPFQRSRELVTDGVYTLSRNPMYLGMVLILGGLAVLLGTLSACVIVVAFALILNVRFVRVEERMLAEAFGDRWSRYAARVRRWL